MYKDFRPNDYEQDYGMDDEFRDQKRHRREKRNGGKHRRDSLEGRDDRYDRWN